MTRLTLQQFVLLLIFSFEVQHKMIQLLDHELILLESFVGDIENGVLVSWLIVHIEDYVCLWDGHDA